ncbi:hypothetical protein L916_13382 [Phytophthora nicotianae]|uniref:Uncharacterized protein n=1 Tax=Phytophthora nicotianae TaxID=4792 RepID=W2ILW5_PHYNI|nr:hypothetical protein L916_13382 [Phytophthora nicotianae]
MGGNSRSRVRQVLGGPRRCSRPLSIRLKFVQLDRDYRSKACHASGEEFNRQSIYPVLSARRSRPG